MRSAADRPKPIHVRSSGLCNPARTLRGVKWNPLAGIGNEVDEAIVLDENGDPVRPPFIAYATACLAATVVGIIAVPIASLGYTAEIKRTLQRLDAKAKVHQLVTANDIEGALKSFRQGYLSLGALLAVTFGIFAYLMLFKGKGWPRWTLLAVGLLTGLPFHVVDITGNGLGVTGNGPLAIRLPMTIAAIAYLGALSLLFTFPSRGYFKACREIFKAELDAARLAATKPSVDPDSEPASEPSQSASNAVKKPKRNKLTAEPAELTEDAESVEHPEKPGTE